MMYSAQPSSSWSFSSTIERSVFSMDGLPMNTRNRNLRDGKTFHEIAG
jgi:hypothetical protein